MVDEDKIHIEIEKEININDYIDANGKINFPEYHKATQKVYLKKLTQRIKAEKIQNILMLSQIPDKIRLVTFDKLKVTDENIFNTLKNIHKTKKWVYLSGINSTGKTMLLGATTNMLADNLKTVFYFNEKMLLERIKNSYNGNTSFETYKIIENIKSCEFILWDEFSFNPYKTKFELGITYEILEIAETMLKTIIFASNIEFTEKIVARIGKRNYARIKRNKPLLLKMKNKPF